MDYDDCVPIGYYETTLKKYDTAVITGYTQSSNSHYSPNLFLVGFPSSVRTITYTFTPAYCGLTTITTGLSTFPAESVDLLLQRMKYRYGFAIDSQDGTPRTLLPTRCINRTNNGSYKISITTDTGKNFIYFFRQQLSKDFNW